MSSLAEQVDRWLADNPRPIPPPKTRTTQQWLTWLHAEGFIEEIESAYHYQPDDM